MQPATFAVVAHRRSATNEALVAAARAWGLDSELLDPHRALTRLEPGDTALARLDVRLELDGIECGTGELEQLAAGGVDVRNLRALAVAHDKLLTARTLRLAGLPHPHSTHLGPMAPAVVPELPLVLKPRFGSWGREVELCAAPSTSGRSTRPAATSSPRPSRRCSGTSRSRACSQPPQSDAEGSGLRPVSTSRRPSAS